MRDGRPSDRSIRDYPDGLRETQTRSRDGKRLVTDGGIRQPRYLPAERIIGEMAHWARARIGAFSSVKILVLGTMGGAFIAVGALLSLRLG